MNMSDRFFKTYVSNTPTSTSHNGLLSPEKPLHETYRAWFRVEEYGRFRWRFFHSNIVNSTWDAGEVVYPDRPGGHWRILSASVSAADGVGMDGVAPVAVTYHGNAGKAVEPAEEFWSDEVTLEVGEGQVLLWEWTVEGTEIPYTKDPLITTQRKTEDGWVPDDSVPMPDLLGCDRQVKKRIAFIGDSITQGCNTPIDACDHWVGRLAFHFGKDYSVWNIGLGYARASDAAYHKSWIKKALMYDTVNVAFGTNDINSGACGKALQGDSADEIIASLEAILTILRDAGKQIILFNAPAFDFDLNPEKLAVWEEVNARVPALAEKFGCILYDFAAVTDHPDLHGRGRYEPHPTGYGCWRIEPDMWEKLGDAYQSTDCLPENPTDS